MAFAISSGVPPEAGLYCPVIAGVLISALGGSKTQVGGPTGSFVVIIVPKLFAKLEAGVRPWQAHCQKVEMQTSHHHPGPGANGTRVFGGKPKGTPGRNGLHCKLGFSPKIPSQMRHGDA
jgi:hypothetical protein